MHLRQIYSSVLVLFLLAGAIGCASTQNNVAKRFPDAVNDPSTWQFKELEVLVHGYSTPEAPTMDTECNLFFVEYGNGNINKVAPDGKTSVIAKVGVQNNGLIIDKDNNLFVGDWKGKTLYKLTPEGKVSVVTSRTADGDSLRGPNDFAWNKNGVLYMTDPKGSNANNLIGLIHYFDQDMKIHTFDGGLNYPNGIAFSPDYKYLYVGETQFNRILRYEINTDGTWKKKDIFFLMGEKVWPDGMNCDVFGNLWVTAWTEQELWCINPAGERVAVVKVPCEKCTPTNIKFDRFDPYIAYITAGSGNDGRVYKTRLPVPGMPQLP